MLDYFFIHGPAFNDILARYTALTGRAPVPPKWSFGYWNSGSVKRWWQSGVKKTLDYGARVFHADFGEEIPRDAVFFNGETGKQIHNIYPNLYGQALYEAFEEYATQPVIANRRSGWAGMQRYPICWSGDPKCTFESMAHVLRGGLSIGLSGVPFWSHDYVKLRYRLIPYIYTYAHVAARSGLPLIRAMVLEFQDDPSTYHLDLQYMFGGEFLVAPIFDTTGERSVYLPAGAWYDYWTKERLTGPKHIMCRAPLDTLPLFVKGRAIIPMGPEMSYVGEKPCSPITLDVYPGGRSRFTIRDDDGDTEIRVRAESAQIDVEIDESQSEFEVVMNRVESARAVTLNGRDLPSLSEPAPGAHGFFIDSSRLVASFAAEGSARRSHRPLVTAVDCQLTGWRRGGGGGSPSPTRRPSRGPPAGRWRRWPAAADW